MCIAPPAQFSHEALEAKATGVVILEGVIEPDGRVHQIQVIQALPYDLTEKAIEAVKSWVLKPATGPDGNPVAVRQVIQVTFHLY